MDIRNVAIIAHVDHGKTTLVDCLLKQSGTFRDNQQVAERAMDSNDLERERGITILAKAPRSSGRARASTSSTRPATPISAARSSASCRWSTAWCCWSTPPKGRCRRPSSCSARRCAWACKPIVVINKVDRPDARAHEVHDEVFDLFSALDASDEQLDFPTLFASARQGWAATSLEAEHKDLAPLFDLILKHVPPPKVDAGRAVPHAGDDARGRQLPRPHPDRPHPSRARSSPTRRSRR